MEYLAVEIEAVSQPKITVGEFFVGFGELTDVVEPTLRSEPTMPPLSEWHGTRIEYDHTYEVRNFISEVTWAVLNIFDGGRDLTRLYEMDVVCSGFAERIWRVWSAIEVSSDLQREVLEKYLGYVESIISQYRVIPEEKFPFDDQPHCFLWGSAVLDSELVNLVIDVPDLQDGLVGSVENDVFLTGLDFLNFLNEELGLIGVIPVSDYFMIANHVFGFENIPNVRAEKVVHLFELLLERGHLQLPDRTRTNLKACLDKFRKKIWAQNYIPLIEGTWSTLDF